MSCRGPVGKRTCQMRNVVLMNQLPCRRWSLDQACERTQASCRPVRVRYLACRPAISLVQWLLACPARELESNFIEGVHTVVNHVPQLAHSTLRHQRFLKSCSC